MPMYGIATYTRGKAFSTILQLRAFLNRMCDRHHFPSWPILNVSFFTNIWTIQNTRKNRILHIVNETTHSIIHLKMPPKRFMLSYTHLFSLSYKLKTLYHLLMSNVQKHACSFLIQTYPLLNSEHQWTIEISWKVKDKIYIHVRAQCNMKVY